MFSNVLPRPIPNAVADQSRHRRGLDSAEVAGHLDHVFSLLPLISRVGLVILSGVDGTDFEHGTTVIRDHCARRGIPATAMPYLGSRGSDETIEAGFTEPGRERLREVIAAFEASTPAQPRHSSWGCADCAAADRR